jgi:hypothetical protein
MSITDREFDGLISKLGFVSRQSDHLLAWFEYDGKVILRTRRSNKRGPLPMEHSIRQQMKLSDGQLREALSCTLGHPEYVALLKTKGLIQSDA